MGKHLNCWVGSIRTRAGCWHTELGTDIVYSRGSVVTSQHSVRKVTTLHSLVQEEVRSLKVGLRNGKIEDTLSSRDCDWYSRIDTSFGGRSGGKNRQDY